MITITVTEGDPVAFWNRWRFRKATTGSAGRENPDERRPDPAADGPGGSAKAAKSTEAAKNAEIADTAVTADTGSAKTTADAETSGRLLELAGRRTVRAVVPVIGKTVLELAEDNGVDFVSHCRRGTCARCRCRVEAGGEYLSAPNGVETARLGGDEIAEGYRLGCQARVTGFGPMRVRHAPYF